jgi:hypothetical protein
MKVAGCAKRGLVDELRCVDFGMGRSCGESFGNPGDFGSFGNFFRGLLTLCENFHIIGRGHTTARDVRRYNVRPLLPVSPFRVG